MNINKPLLIAVFAVLFIVMVLDLIFVFPNMVKAVLYGGAFVVGLIIYLNNNDVKDIFKKKESDTK